jgi:integrase
MPKTRTPKLGRIFKKFNRGKDGQKVYHSTFTIRFKGRDYATGTDDIKAAEKQLLKLIGESANDARRTAAGVDSVMVNDLLALVLADYEREGKANIKSVRAHINLHLVPHLGSVRAIDLSKDDVDRYKDRRVLEKASKATVNRELAALSRGFTLVREQGKKIEVPAIRKFTEDNVRTGFIGREQYKVLYAELPDYLKPILCVAYHVGDRMGELLSMRMSQVNLIHKEIDLDPGTTKNKRGRTAPIYGEMIPVLSEWMARTRGEHPNCPWLFHLDGNQIQSFRKAWGSACERAGLPDLLFHDLRRSAVRNLTRAGVPRAVAMQITGHKTESVYRRYYIVDAADVRMAGAMLETFASRK